MKFICKKSDLSKGVGIVLKAVPSKTTMSILECILIDASAGQIKLTANDMELGIETVIEGDIQEKGIIAIDAKIFSEIVRKLPDNPAAFGNFLLISLFLLIRLNQEGFHQNKAAGRKLPARPAQEFPVEALISFRFDTVSAGPFMQGIINADQDAEQIRLQMERIDFPSRIQIHNAIPADAAVDEIPFHSGAVAGKPGGDHARVSGAESFAVESGSAACGAAAVCNGVSLKQYGCFCHVFIPVF